MKNIKIDIKMLQFRDRSQYITELRQNYDYTRFGYSILFFMQSLSYKKV